MSQINANLQPELAALYDETLVHLAGSERNDALAHDVIHIHFCIANRFIQEGEAIASFGPRNLGLLLSSTGRLQGLPSVHDKATHLLVGLTRNRPFKSANTRTAYLTVIALLQSAGYTITAKGKSFETMLLNAAQQDLSQFPRYRDLVKKGATDADIQFLSHYLRQNTQKSDGARRQITYRALKDLLASRGITLELADDTLTIQRDETVEVKKKGLFAKSESQTNRQTIWTADFPGWNKPVAKARLSQLREALNLTQEHGVDNAAFFEGVDEAQILADLHQATLTRLAEQDS